MGPRRPPQPYETGMGWLTQATCPLLMGCPHWKRGWRRGQSAAMHWTSCELPARGARCPPRVCMRMLRRLLQLGVALHLPRTAAARLATAGAGGAMRMGRCACRSCVHKRGVWLCVLLVLWVCQELHSGMYALPVSWTACIQILRRTCMTACLLLTTLPRAARPLPCQACGQGPDGPILAAWRRWPSSTRPGTATAR